jgi:prepilin-type N-terminal cleavage/methylation domain-containing protein
LSHAPTRADSDYVRRAFRRLRSDDGFSLVELIIAMMILNIGLAALLSALVSSATTLRRASRTATASALADAQVELYRALTYSAIALDSSAAGATDSTYTSDAAISVTSNITTTTGCTTTLSSAVTASSSAQAATPGSMSTIAPGSQLTLDRGTASAETFNVTTTTPTTFSAVFTKSHSAGAVVLLPQCTPSRTVTGPDHGSYRIDTYITAHTPPTGRAGKLVTVVVRDGAGPSTTLVRQSTAFDASTGS